MIRDFSYVNDKPDHVRCNNCENEMLVDYDVDDCPICGAKGSLMDIHQECNDDYLSHLNLA